MFYSYSLLVHRLLTLQGCSVLITSLSALIPSGAHEKKCRQERATPTYLIEFRVQALSSCVAILRIPNSAHGHFTLVTRTRTPKLENTMMATPSRNLALKAILKRLQRDDKDN